VREGIYKVINVESYNKEAKGSSSG